MPAAGPLPVPRDRLDVLGLTGVHPSSTKLHDFAGAAPGSHTSGGTVVGNIATAGNQYPYVLNNNLVDSNFGITEPIFLDDLPVASPRHHAWPSTGPVLGVLRRRPRTGPVAWCHQGPPILRPRSRRPRCRQRPRGSGRGPRGQWSRAQVPNWEPGLWTRHCPLP